MLATVVWELFDRDPIGARGNGVDLTYFLVGELAKSFGFPCKKWAAESLGDFRYGLSPRHLRPGAPRFDRTLFQARTRLSVSTIFSINNAEERSRGFVIMAAGSD